MLSTILMDKLRVFFAATICCAVVSACGGGGGGSSSANVPIAADPRNPPGSTPVTPQTPSPDTANESSFVAGVFPPSSRFADLCGAPRTTTSNEVFSDMQGTFEDEGNWLRSWSNETYLWYDEIEDVNPADYAGSAADVETYFDLLKTMATTPSGNPKDRFHYSRDTAEYRAETRKGVTYGYGATYQLLSTSPPRELVIVLVKDDSPASAAGLSRGARIVTVDGMDLINGDDPATLNAGLWPNQRNQDHTFEVVDPGSSNKRAITMTSAQISIDAVPQTRILNTDSGKVGYLLFTDHILTAEQQLVDAITEMAEAGITDLVLDLRYNRGGYLYLANQLSYMIAGGGVSGQIFNALQFNNKHPTNNPITGEPLAPDTFLTTTVEATPQGTALPTLALVQPRVFVLTTGSTCSASEAIINGLRGVNVEVYQFGKTTCGKPYGFYPEDNCGTTYFSTQFRSVNALKFGDYPDGFSPSNTTEAKSGVAQLGCEVADDYSPLGVADEPMLAAALAYRANPGTCPIPPSARAPSAIGNSPDSAKIRARANGSMMIRLPEF